jgi:hypothetical protein
MRTFPQHVETFTHLKLNRPADSSSAGSFLHCVCTLADTDVREPPLGVSEAIPYPVRVGGHYTPHTLVGWVGSLSPSPIPLLVKAYFTLSHYRYDFPIFNSDNFHAFHPFHTCYNSDSPTQFEGDKQQEKKMVYLIKIESLPASVRLRNTMLKAGIETLGDVFAMTITEILAIKNFGLTTLDELDYILKNLGFSFLGKNEFHQEFNSWYENEGDL